MKIQIEQATPDKASHIASLIMEAMNAQCCQNFAGPQHTLVDFHRMMTKLVEMEDSQYSYLLAELKKRLKISIFLWRKSCASR
jgi:hypothetical protein